jgi:tetratricopeptide (TPR) repeat protein
MNAPSAVELEVQRLRALASGRQFAAVLEGTRGLLVRVPENRDVLLLQALAQRQLGEIPAALATLGTLERLYPRFSRLYQERGQCYVALKQAPEAISAFQRGVHINPALPVSWSMLEGLYRIAGQPDNAAQAAAHVATLTSLPPEVVTATALFSDGELAEAEACAQLLVRHGHHIEAMRLLAHRHRATGSMMRSCCPRVLDVAPDYDAARFEYAQCSASARCTSWPRSRSRSCSPRNLPTAITARCTR